MNPVFLNILADSATTAQGGDTSVQMWNTIIMFGGIMVLMWVLMIRPQQKKQKELTQRIASLKTGDRVVTTGGVHGVVSNIKDGPTLTLKVDDTCKLTVDKSAIVTVIAKEAKDASSAS